MRHVSVRDATNGRTARLQEDVRKAKAGRISAKGKSVIVILREIPHNFEGFSLFLFQNLFVAL